MKRAINLALWKSTIILFVLFLSVSAFAQQNGVIRCATVEMDSIRHANDPNLQTNEEFEEWLEKLIDQKERDKANGKIIGGVYQIPVVVHVIHNGEPIGTGDNLSAAVIQSQIDVLNEDFRKIFGTPGYNTHIVGADTEIEFCLARRRPDGSAFPPGDDGINRVDRNSTPWGGTLGAPPYTTAEINASIKPWSTGTDLGGWDPADYMNFWVMDISGGILGYAQFPTSSLGGMGCGAQSTATDGVVMLTSSIGKSSVTGFPGPYNEGRTATHEIGHWLGLRHIWGDGGCGVDDFCADTPLSDASNFGCPVTNSCTDNYASPPWPTSDPNDMVENYMDYSDDACMNIFTYDQKTRMRTVLENSPIRASLINSDACIPPASDDASIIDVLMPQGDNCAGPITPSVTIKNRGANTLTSAVIEYTIDGGTPTSFSWTGSVASGGTANVTLPAFTAPLGIHTFQAYSTLPNTVIDPDPSFDTSAIQFAVSEGYQPNHFEDFEAGTFPPDVRWRVDNPNGDCMLWTGQSSTSSGGVYPNDAACAAFFNNNGAAQEEYLYTPIFILPCNASSAEVVFDRAYRRRINASSDRLRLEMSLDCGATWTNTLFDAQGAALATGGNSNSYWIPGTAGDWVEEIIDLTSFVTGTSQNVQFRFRASNSGNQGGNVYVDDFEFNAVTPGEIEVTASGTYVLDGGFYDFGSQPVGSPTTVTFTISNPGTSNLILTGPIVVTGAEYNLNTTFGSTTVAPGGTTTFSIDFTPTGPGPFTGNVSFGTNDCDESTYNFELTGAGNVTPPTAAFTSNGVLVCEGGTITYTDASSGASSWTWSFPGGVPASATGQGPHVVTYPTAGTYDAQLDVSNTYGSDTDLQSNLITVLPGSGGALPISEGFDGGTFLPTNWSLGNGGSTAVTWVQDPNNNGTAPTPGNSTVIDMFTSNTAGDQDSLFAPPADFTSLSSAQLTFDVAYAQYNGTYNDRLQVLVSSDCGQTWNVEYDKAGSVLATDPDQTAGYTAPSTWRNEVVDLSAYVGSSKVDVAFVSISGWGQYLYLDNVNITGVGVACTDPDVPTVTYTPATVCEGSSATLTISGNLNDATAWNIYSGSCGGTLETTTTTSSATVTPVGPSTTYYVRGEGGCVTPGTCGTVTVNVTPVEDPSFSYGSASYCADAVDPTPTISGTPGGTFTSSPAGLSINNTTGVIDLSLSTPNTYTVTYTTPGTCSATSNVAVTVNALPAASTIVASGPTTFCAGGSVSLTSSQGSGNVWSTTETTQSINVTSSGSYSVTYTDGNGCSATSAPTVVTVNANPATPTISASGPTTFCTGGSVDLTSSQTSGNVWSTTETTQTINVSSTGTYSVTYTDGNGCSATSAPTVVTVNANPAAPTIAANGPTTFCAGGSVDLTSSQASGNVWSTTETTQTINVSTSGSYSVTYTDGNGCSATSAPTVVTVNATPATPTISASGPTTFCAGGSVTLTSSQGSGNVWSTTSTSNNIAVTTSGSYTVTYTDGNGCSATSAPTNVTVNPAPVIVVGTVQDPSACATSTGSIQITGSGTGVVSWTGTASGSSGSVTLPYTITGLAAGSYNITFDNGCTSNTLSQSLTDPTPPAAPVITPSGATTFCSGGSVTLTSSYASGNTWSTTETTQSINITTSGTYSVTYTDGSGCSSSSAPIVVTVNANPATPTITPSGSTTFCSGGSVNLSSSQATGNVWSTTETTQTINVTSSGSYTVTYTDGNGCSATSAPTVVTVNATPATPTISASGPTTFCAGGSVDLTSSQTSGNVWSTTETTQTINVTSSGAYSVTYTAGNGCSATSAPVSVTVNPVPVISIGGVSNPTACGTSTGSITVNGSGTGVVTWTGTASGNSGSVSLPYTITGLPAGSYAITMDQNGCTSNTLTPSLSDPSAPTAPNIVASGATTFCAGGSVTLTSSYASGNVWSTTETTQAINVTTSGTYSVTYTDGSGCSSTSAPITVTVNANPSAPVVTPSGSTTFCAGGSVDLTSDQVSGNVWSTTETTQTINITASGSYDVTYTDGNGCSATSASIVVTVNALPSAPVVTPSGATTFCDGGSVDLTSDQASGNLWSTSETTQTINVTTSGTYDVTYTDGNGCSSTSTPVVVTVNANPVAPIITASGATTFCDGGSVDLSSDQVSGNVWSTTETTQSINVTTSGTYSVTYTDGNGCSAVSASTVVTVNALPAVTQSFLDTICEQADPFTLSGGSPSGGTYSGTGVSGGVFDPGTAGAGSHVITYSYTDGNGCTGTAQSDIVVEDCSGLMELVEGGLLIYPNPTSDIVYISSSNAEIRKVRVYDSSGRLVYKKDNNEDIVPVNLENFARGIYSVEVEAGGFTFHTRVIRQ